MKEVWNREFYVSVLGTDISWKELIRVKRSSWALDTPPVWPRPDGTIRINYNMIQRVLVGFNEYFLPESEERLSPSSLEME